MIRRPTINARRKAPRTRLLLTAAGDRLRDAGGAVEEHVLWRGGDLLRLVLDLVRWPFERLAWAIERVVVWPVGERTASWGTRGRTVALGGVALLASGVLAFGASGGGSGGDSSPSVAESPQSPPTQNLESAAPEPAPVLHGAVPDFTPEQSSDPGAKVAKADTVISSNPDTATSAASASAADGEPQDPGPAAIEVARRFSGAFVLYETGRTDSKVRSAFDATASPRLTQALLRRPPRLPANVKVPQAKVLNVVPGPRHGGTFTLSASLLRVGVTSELRIDVQRDTNSGAWQVTDVLG